MRNLTSRIGGTLAVHAVLALLFWLFVRFSMAKQDSLSQALRERFEGNPARIETYVSDISGKLLIAGFGVLALSAVLASIWLWTIHHKPPYGDESARSKRTSWLGLMVIGLLAAAGIFWLTVLGAAISNFMAPNVGTYTMALALALVLIGYWLSTLLFVPENAKVAVPAAAAVRR